MEKYIFRFNFNHITFIISVNSVVDLKTMVIERYSDGDQRV